MNIKVTTDYPLTVTLSQVQAFSNKFKTTVSDLLFEELLFRRPMDPVLLEYLLLQGVNVNGVFNKMDSILHEAINYNVTEAVKFLIDHGADVNKKLNGRSPIYRAVMDTKPPEMIEYLVSHGCVCFYSMKNELVCKTWMPQCINYMIKLNKLLKAKHCGPEVSEYILLNTDYMNGDTKIASMISHERVRPGQHTGQVVFGEVKKKLLEIDVLIDD